MTRFTWQDPFLALFDRCLARYRAGEADWTTYYSEADLGFLASIGYQPREFFDFVEDYGDGAPLPAAAALLVASARRDYFLVVQGGRASGTFLPADRLPAKSDASLGSRPYFARLLKKARLKLRGELDPEIMFGCGGDRNFLMECDIHPADFLRHVWAAGDDDAKVVAMVESALHSAA
ncbi:MAG: hypothetical protein ACKV19_19645 [Verrucomicrobiales bacterium]